ncbi:MAG: hypothetical protein ACRDUA_15355 [Micromonosporaceae bacterium]
MTKLEGAQADVNDHEPRSLDAAGMWYELGREIQAVALIMRKHRLVAAQQLCECGRLFVHTLPVFGARCDVAYRQWVSAFAMMRTLTREQNVPDRVVGRASAYGPEPRR